MRARVLALTLALALLAGCGDDDEEAGDGATGATGAAGPQVTVGEFLGQIRPDKQATLAEVTGAVEACQGIEVDNPFVLLITAEAIDADPEAPLAELVAPRC